MSSAEVESIIDKFDALTRKPVKFLSVQEDVKDDIKNLVKSLYDYTKSQENGEKKTALPKLIIEDFDEEQIWQEIELQNTECWDHFVWEVANCISSKDALLFPIETPQPSEKQVQNEAQESDNEAMSDDEDRQDIETERVSNKSKDKKQKYKSSIVDDKFFKLKQMEHFLLKEEKNDGKANSDSDNESIDMFEDMDSEDDEEEGGKEMMYDDFFDQQDDDNGIQQELQDDEEKIYENEGEDEEMPEQKEPKKKDTKKKEKFTGISSDDESGSQSDDSEAANKEIDNKPKHEKKSEFELRQQRLQQTISRLEQKTLADAPWQLKGEVDATRRPQNSLLQEVVDFDLTSRPAPIITEQTTVTLEDIIKQRIKDKAWDDVVKKEKPVDDQLSFRKQEVLDQSKSKLSLAQVYEAEYLKQKQLLSGEPEEEKEPEAHTQIREAMAKLFSKLDALSHYHYTPKPPQAEVKIVSNTPAISMEEVAPVATSDATLLAPEEIKRKRKGDLMSKEERTQTDKNRERRKKKKLQRKKGHVQKVTEHRNTSKGAEASDKSLKTSKAFFQQLNDDSTSIIKKKKNIKNKGQ